MTSKISILIQKVISWLIQFFDVTASWCTDEPGANAARFLVEGADVPGVFVVVDHDLVISEVARRVVAHGHEWHRRSERALLEHSSSERSASLLKEID